MRGQSYRLRVNRVQRLTEEIFSVWLCAPRLAKGIKPGQFLGVKVTGRDDFLLRRPLSVADVSGNSLRVIFRVVGEGTRVLSRAKVGDEWDVLAPLGSPAPLVKGRDVVLCGGGVGVAPLFYFARRLSRENRLTVLVGARTARELILVRDFRRLGARVAVATEDGSMGYRGVVSELVEQALGGLRSPVVFACGPEGMLRILGARCGKVPVWGFFEQRLGCGVGLCYGCGLKRKTGGYLRLCKEGPVVRLDEVVL